MRMKRRPRISSAVGRSSSSQSLLSPWVTNPFASPDTIRCMTIVSRSPLRYATTSPTA
jgi:hypothetical protein